MSREAVLARGRAAAEAGMVDHCVIRRVIARNTDPDTGEITPQYLYPHPYAGPCRIQQDKAQAQRHDVGEDHQLMLRLELQLPMSATGLEVGDEVTITAAAHDGDLVGRVLLISDLAHKTHATARRVQCVERTGS